MSRAYREVRPSARKLDELSARRPTILKALLVLVLLVWPLLFKNAYGMSVMTTAGFFAILTISVGLILGQAGQLSFAQSAFYGIGAYTAGLMAMKLHVPTLMCLVAGGAAAGFVALVVGRPVLRLRYFYLAFATIGLGQIFTIMMVQLRGVTGGSLGFGPVPTLSLFGFSVNTYMRQYYVVWVIALLILLFTQRLLKFRVGRALRAIATSEIASSTLGVRNANWKLVTFAVSAVFCGLAGGLFAFVVGAVSPNSFTFTASILPIVMMLVGGDRTIWGAIIGAIVMTWVVNGFAGMQQYSGVAYSVIMILLLLFLPAGILGGLHPAQRARLRALFKRERLSSDSVACAMAAEADQPHEQCETTVALPFPATATEPAAGLLATAPIALSVHGTTVDGVAATEPSASGAPVLRVEGLSVQFGGLKAVNDVSLSVPKGEITALIGPNGAGKTTLFNAVSRLQKLSAGKVWFGERDVTGLSPADTARLGLARTFQNLRIFGNMSVLENVLVGCHRHESSGFWAGGLGLPNQRREERASRARALAALALVGLEDHATKPAVSLPYGQQRLVEIARALASEPQLLMLDEPAAGMNAGERAYLVERIAQIKEAGITVFLVEHDIALVMGISHEVNVLDYGRLIATGKPEEVQGNQAVIQAYLGVERDKAKDLCATRNLVDGSCAEPEQLMVIDQLATSYGTIEALHGVSLSVPKGEVVAVLGANGAGKTTLLHTISGLLRPTRGSVVHKGADITHVPAEKIVARGICQVLEGRQLFPSLSVEHNLEVGASGRRDRRSGFADDIAYVCELFPVLGERRRQPAGTLSGGEQQMLAIGRALMGRPELLLLDEPSMGLAPKAVERIFEALAKLNAQGLTMLMVEQNAEMALSLAHRAVVLQTGNVVLSGKATDLRQDARVRASYLGHGGA